MRSRRSTVVAAVLTLAAALQRPKWPQQTVLRLKGGSEKPQQEQGDGLKRVLSVVPVFALTDDKGRPVLVVSNDTAQAKPVQLWFTDVNVARAHATEIAKLGGEKSLDLKIAMSNLDQVRTAGNATLTDREVRVCADPREVHVARQLILRAAGFVNSNGTDDGSAAAAIDFSNETVVTKAANSLQAAIGVDFDKDVPLFTLAALNATLGGNANKVVQPWFMSFADLVRAYVNSTVPSELGDDEYKARAQAALDAVLKVGQTAVTTLDKIVASVEKGNDAVFIMPPASSVDAISKARLEQQRSLLDDPPVTGSFSTSSSSSSPSLTGGTIFDDDENDAPGSDLFH